MRFDGMADDELCRKVGDTYVLMLRGCPPIECDDEATARQCWNQILVNRKRKADSPRQVA